MIINEELDKPLKESFLTHDQRYDVECQALASVYGARVPRNSCGWQKHGWF
jgi:hypothetical protein